jgi:hypothetical protein
VFLGLFNVFERVFLRVFFEKNTLGHDRAGVDRMCGENRCNGFRRFRLRPHPLGTDCVKTRWNIRWRRSTTLVTDLFPLEEWIAGFRLKDKTQTLAAESPQAEPLTGLRRRDELINSHHTDYSS